MSVGRRFIIAVGVSAALAAGVLGIRAATLFADARSYSASPDCPGPPRDNCRYLDTYRIVRVYDAGSAIERHLVLEWEYSGPMGANRCPPEVCTPNLTMAGPAANYAALLPGTKVTAVVWRGKIVQLRTADGKGMDTSLGPDFVPVVTPQIAAVAAGVVLVGSIVASTSQIRVSRAA